MKVTIVFIIDSNNNLREKHQGINLRIKCNRGLLSAKILTLLMKEEGWSSRTWSFKEIKYMEGQMKDQHRKWQCKE